MCSLYNETHHKAETELSDAFARSADAALHAGSGDSSAD